MMGRRGKYSTVGGEVACQEERRIVPVPASSNNRGREVSMTLVMG
jgi:hypothetical protein